MPVGGREAALSVALHAGEQSLMQARQAGWATLKSIVRWQGSPQCMTGAASHRDLSHTPCTLRVRLVVKARSNPRIPQVHLAKGLVKHMHSPGAFDQCTVKPHPHLCPVSQHLHICCSFKWVAQPACGSMGDAIWQSASTHQQGHALKTMWHCCIRHHIIPKSPYPTHLPYPPI